MNLTDKLGFFSLADKQLLTPITVYNIIYVFHFSTTGYLEALKGEGAGGEINQVLERTGVPKPWVEVDAVTEELRMSLAKEQASCVLW